MATASSAKVIPFTRRLEHLIEDAARPIRLYHAQKRKWFLWYWYANKVAAMRQALWIAKWLEIGETVEVVDVRNGELLGAYTRRVAHVEFHREQRKTAPHEIRLTKG
jgi:hypothetical protein